MKKIIISGAIVIAAVAGGTYMYKSKNTNASKIDAQMSKPQPQKIEMSGKGSCTIKYEISKDNGKTWKDVYEYNGKKQVPNQTCWKAYGKLLAKFDKKPDAKGKLHGKIDGNPIRNPSMKFSQTPKKTDKK